MKTQKQFLAKKITAMKNYNFEPKIFNVLCDLKENIQIILPWNELKLGK